MLSLIANENMKIYRRIRTWILIGLIVLVTVTVAVIYHSTRDVKTNNNEWRGQLQQDIAMNKQQIETSKDLPESIKEMLKKQNKISEYRLEHDIPPAQEDIWSYVMMMSNLIFIVTGFTTIVAADIVAGEFIAGTIKLLLIRPSSRTKILLSKYVATLAFSILLLAVLFTTAFLMGGILSGMSGVGTSYLYAGKDLVVHEDSMLTHALNTYGLKCVSLVMVVTLAFMISTVFRSSLLSIGISLVTMFIGSSVVVFVRKYAWAKYYLFANTDLTQYLEGEPMLEGTTMAFSILVLIAYFLIFNALSWFIFNKRDVAA